MRKHGVATLPRAESLPTALAKCMKLTGHTVALEWDIKGIKDTKDTKGIRDIKVMKGVLPVK